jgi:hypothetical protein
MRAQSCFIVIGMATSACAFVVPNGFDNVDGNSSFLLTTTTAPGRTYQFVIHEDQLTGLQGMFLNGLQARLNGTATAAWPSVDTSYSRFEIFIGQGVAPSARTSTFANNFVGAPTQVRSGGLTFNANSFSATGSPVKPFGPVVSFSNYLYTGGHLAIQLKYSNHVGTTSGLSLDACTSSTAGYGTQFAALWQSNPDGTTALTTTANFVVLNLTGTPVPEPATLAALGLGTLAIARRRSRR